jgi:hypothetical protein
MIHLVWKLKTEAELHVDLYFQTFKNHISNFKHMGGGGRGRGPAARWRRRCGGG